MRMHGSSRGGRQNPLYTHAGRGRGLLGASAYDFDDEEDDYYDDVDGGGWDDDDGTMEGFENFYGPVSGSTTFDDDLTNSRLCRMGGIAGGSTGNDKTSLLWYASPFT